MLKHCLDIVANHRTTLPYFKQRATGLLATFSSSEYREQ